jgi:hypothetical protein
MVELAWSSSGMILTGELNLFKKNCPNTTLSTKNPAWTGL